VHGGAEVQPRLPAALQRPDVSNTPPPEFLRHTGAGGFVRSGAVDDDRTRGGELGHAGRGLIGREVHGGGDPARIAVEMAGDFDRAVLSLYPGIIASRRNYDVGQGYDGSGVFRCGVLDQSWRIGGTSGVEVAAVRVFKERPDVTVLKGSSFNVYGSDAVAPTAAIIHFQGVDQEFGPMLMYTQIEIAR